MKNGWYIEGDWKVHYADGLVCNGMYNSDFAKVGINSNSGKWAHYKKGYLHFDSGPANSDNEFWVSGFFIKKVNCSPVVSHKFSCFCNGFWWFEDFGIMKLPESYEIYKKDENGIYNVQSISNSIIQYEGEIISIGNTFYLKDSEDKIYYLGGTSANYWTHCGVVMEPGAKVKFIIELGRVVVHCKDKPAYSDDFFDYYYFGDMLHRADGPAVVSKNNVNDNKYFLYGYEVDLVNFENYRKGAPWFGKKRGNIFNFDENGFAHDSKEKGSEEFPQYYWHGDEVSKTEWRKLSGRRTKSSVKKKNDTITDLKSALKESNDERDSLKTELEKLRAENEENKVGGSSDLSLVAGLAVAALGVNALIGSKKVSMPPPSHSKEKIIEKVIERKENK